MTQYVKRDVEFLEAEIAQLLAENKELKGRIAAYKEATATHQSEVDDLQSELDRHTLFALFVVASIKKTQNAGYVFTNTPENILAGAKEALESEEVK